MRNPTWSPDKMNILMVGDTIPQDKPGGGGTYLWEVSKRLANAGHGVYVLVQRHDPTRPVSEIKDGVHIHRFDYRRNNLLNSLADRFKLSKRIFDGLAETVDFDLIDIHFALGGFAVVCSPKTQSIPCLYTFHGPWSGESLIEDQKQLEEKGFLCGSMGRLMAILRFQLKLWIEKALCHRIDHFLVLSNFNRRLLVNTFNISPRKITVIPAGVDTRRFTPNINRNAAKEVLELPTDLPVLLTVRRLTARMGLERLIGAVRCVLQKRIVILVIAGTGPLEHRLKALAKEYNLQEHIRFVGQISEELLPLYYQAADLFVLPSLDFEGFGLVTLEALSSGLPVVGTNIGGTPEILENLDPRLLVEKTSAEKLAEGIMTTLDRHQYKPDDLHRFTIENHSWNAIFPRLEELFQDTAAFDSVLSKESGSSRAQDTIS